MDESERERERERERLSRNGQLFKKRMTSVMLSDDLGCTKFYVACVACHISREILNYTQGHTRSCLTKSADISKTVRHRIIEFCVTRGELTCSP